MTLSHLVGFLAEGWGGRHGNSRYGDTWKSLEVHMDPSGVLTVPPDVPTKKNLCGISNGINVNKAPLLSRCPAVHQSMRVVIRCKSPKYNQQASEDQQEPWEKPINDSDVAFGDCISRGLG